MKYFIVCLLIHTRLTNGHLGEDYCKNPKNKIVEENCKPGKDSTFWDVNGGGDPSILGFTSEFSYRSDEIVEFKIKTDSELYRIDIYRLGYYRGAGARLVDVIYPQATLPQKQPDCIEDDDTLLYDCGNWAVSAEWTIPKESVSGLYFGRPTRLDKRSPEELKKNWRTDNSQVGYDRIHAIPGADHFHAPLHDQPNQKKKHAYGASGFGNLRNKIKEPRASHIWFVLRDEDRDSDLVFQTADATWQAYNGYGGYTTYGTFDFPYTHGPNPKIEPSVLDEEVSMRRSYKTSYNRPFIVRGYRPVNMPLNAEYPAIRFLEKNGYDMTYISGIDAARNPALLLKSKVFLSVGHDEYWSGEQRKSVTAARDAGVNLIFWSGNECYWKVRHEDNYRTMVIYKETQSLTKIDPKLDTWTGTWRDGRDINPEGAQPENELTGTIFTVNAQRIDPLQVPFEFAKLRFWRNTEISSKLKQGDEPATLLKGLLGHEWDQDLNNGFRPKGLVRMSQTTVDGVQYVYDHGATFDTGTATHHMVMYKADSGALVWGAGTVQFSWGLDNHHDIDDPGRRNKYDTRVSYDLSGADRNLQQLTVNILADMKAQPQSIDTNLTKGWPSMDVLAPSCIVKEIVSSSSFSSWNEGESNGVIFTIAGSSFDDNMVAAVEVTVDNGKHWLIGELVSYETTADSKNGLLKNQRDWSVTYGLEDYETNGIYLPVYKFDAIEVIGCRAVDDSLNMGEQQTFDNFSRASAHDEL